jgi:hypothetical protein
MATELPPAETPIETKPADVIATEAANAAETAPPTVATAPPEAAPPPDPPVQVPVPTRRRRDRILGTAGQVVGIVGLVVCLLLVVGDVFAREWAVSTVDDVSAAVDAQISKVDPILSQASARVGEVQGRVATVADLAATVAANPSPGGAVADTLRTALASVSERYQTLRSNYADVRESVVSMVDRLKTLDRILPGFSVPQGPVDALAALDARLQEFDSNVNGLITIDPGNGPVNQAAAAISQKAGEIDARIQGVQGGLGDVQQRLSALQTKLSDTAGTLKMAITLGTVGTIILLLYLALLHWVLFRHSGEIRRKTSAG